VLAGPSAAAIHDLMLSLTAEAATQAPSPASLPFYDLNLRVVPDTGRLQARVELDYPNSTGAPLAELPLRIFANARGPLVRVTSVHAIGRTASLQAAADPTLVAVALDPPVPVGAFLHLSYEVAGVVPTSQAGAPDSLAASLLSEPSRAPDYGLFARFKDGVALADWLPTAAARFDGAFDLGDPAPVGDTAFVDLSSFRAEVELPAEYRLAAPGALLGEQILPDGFKQARVALADARDFALFASKRYRVAEGREDPFRVRVIYEEGHAAQGQSVLTSARRALARLSEELTPYPWTQFTAVEVPLGGGAGGAEFSSQIAIAGMFFEDTAPVGFGLALSGPFLADLREFTVAHEVAHQWWAIQVGSHPRLEPDVDEPLAQATAALLLTPRGEKRDRKKLVDQEIAVNYQAMRILQGEDGPAARPTSSFESTATYAGLVYGKAPFFYLKLAERIGDDDLWRGLKAYAQAHRFGVARRGDVVRAFAEIGLLPVSQLRALWEQWFEQAHGDVDLAGRGDPAAAAGELFGGDKAETGAAGSPVGSGEEVDPAELIKAARLALDQAARGKGDPQTGEQPLIDPGQAKALLQQLDRSFGGATDESP